VSKDYSWRHEQGTAAPVERGLCSHVLNPIPYSKSWGGWTVRREPSVGGRGQPDHSNGIAEGQAEESSESHAVRLVAFDGDELGDASLFGPVAVVMLDDLSSELDSSEDPTAVRPPLAGSTHENEGRPEQCWQRLRGVEPACALPSRHVTGIDWIRPARCDDPFGLAAIPGAGCDHIPA